MESKIKFDYFYGKEADTFSFYRIPKLLFTEPMFKGLTSEAKILYGLLLDRMSLSIKNGWFDEEGRAYIYFAIEDIAELLNCGVTIQNPIGAKNFMVKTEKLNLMFRHCFVPKSG